jgi:hypothetical protein
MVSNGRSERGEQFLSAEQRFWPRLPILLVFRYTF